MVAVLLFWKTNMAAVTSCENALQLAWEITNMHYYHNKRKKGCLRFTWENRSVYGLGMCEQESRLVNFVPESPLPFAQISSIYRNTNTKGGSVANNQRNQALKFPWGFKCLVALLLLFYVICASVPSEELCFCFPRLKCSIFIIYFSN